MIELTLHDTKTGVVEKTDTEGCLILYFDTDSNIKTLGKINLKALTPILTKVIMEKMTK